MKHDAAERVKIYLATLISVCVSVLIYTWALNSGKISSWASTTSYYDMLADAFLHGQTDLLVKPDPHLLTLPDPYDPVANMRYRLHDASLYRGKYYLYWGPVPSLLLAPVKWVRNAVSVSEAETWLNAVFHGRVRWVRNAVSVGDAYLVFGFGIGEVVFSALLLLALWRRLFYGSPWWSIIPGVLVAGLGTPMPYLFGRAAIYEAAIIAGQYFLVGGIYWAFTALQHGRFSPWRLFLAGVFWASAVGSRLGLVFAVPILSLLVVWRIYRESTGRLLDRLCLPKLSAFVTPLLIGAMALGFYNYTRFGLWTEFGVRFQLAGVHVARLIDASNFLSTAHILPNLFSYFLCPISFIPGFPFITGQANVNYTEQVASILLASPFVWFALVPLALLGPPWRTTGYPYKLTQEARETSWIVICLLCAVLVGIVPVLMMMSPAMRYLADMTPSLVILAMIGVWQSHHLLRPKPLGTRVWFFLVVGLTLVSATIGILFGQSKP